MPPPHSTGTLSNAAIHLSVYPMTLAQKWCILWLWLPQNTNRSAC